MSGRGATVVEGVESRADKFGDGDVIAGRNSAAHVCDHLIDNPLGCQRTQAPSVRLPDQAVERWPRKCMVDRHSRFNSQFRPHRRRHCVVERSQVDDTGSGIKQQGDILAMCVGISDSGPLRIQSCHADILEPDPEMFRAHALSSVVGTVAITSTPRRRKTERARSSDWNPSPASIRASRLRSKPSPSCSMTCCCVSPR